MCSILASHRTSVNEVLNPSPLFSASAVSTFSTPLRMCRSRCGLGTPALHAVFRKKNICPLRLLHTEAGQFPRLFGGYSEMPLAYSFSSSW